MKNIKIKPLTKDQIIISLDRLTRFKNPEIKYLRVFFDIIAGNLIEPKFKKSDLEKMDYAQIRDLAQEIMNFSFTKLGFAKTEDYSINTRLYEYEKSVFGLSCDTEKLLKNKIRYADVISLIDENAPKNLQWLKFLSKEIDITQAREKYLLGFPINKVVIAEGATEEILLPEFAKVCGYDFDKTGVKILSAGGKNQVVKLYYELAQTLKLPIFVLLDKDAKENLDQITPRLRAQDKIHLLECGEFEDLLPLDLVKRTLDEELSNISIIETGMIETDIPRVKALEEIFKTRGRHEFKKAEFARMVKNNIKTTLDISPEIARIIEEIKAVACENKK